MTKMAMTTIRLHVAAAAVTALLGVTHARPVAAQVQTLSCPTGFGPVLVPPAVGALMSTLKGVPNPVYGPPEPVPPLKPIVPPELIDYVVDVPAAIQLGKALFWEMQAGSDGKTACATCHFKAGADGRSRHQLNPGANGRFDGAPLNKQLTRADYPFTDVGAGRDSDNVTGSQGVRASIFAGVSASGVEQTVPAMDPQFTVAGVRLRHTTGMNAPTVINSVFNHRQFWNGRAQPEFNGVNPFGARDTSARVWRLDFMGQPALASIVIRNASLASQAVGPAMSAVEMAAAGRTFPDLGKKLLASKPLALQAVSPTDSVLGPLAGAPKGLNTTYAAMIQAAFQPWWWDSTARITMNGRPYTMMQANFSLFWGVAIMMYEATLVSDDSPLDQYLASRLLDPATAQVLRANETLLDPVVSRFNAEGVPVTRQSILDGLSLFERPVAPPPSFPAPAGFGVGCIGCHVGAETTGASVRNVGGLINEPGRAAFVAAGFDPRMERFITKLDWNPPGAVSPVPQGADAVAFDPVNFTLAVNHITGQGNVNVPLPVKVYDSGWYNVGVRPTREDPGLGGLDPFRMPLSWVGLFQATNATTQNLPGDTLGCFGMGTTLFPNQLVNAKGLPLLSGPLRRTDPTDVAGTFKAPGLRNVELTGPYFHNGGKMSLAQVVGFYAGGADFGLTTNPTKHPAVLPLGLSAQQIDDLVAFLVSMTDDRVAYERAPFDHPELLVPEGDRNGTDIMVRVPAVGAAGVAQRAPRFLGVNPFTR